jgi:hypothetical protein
LRRLTAEQQEILSHLSIVNLPDGRGGAAKTIRLSGVNLQVVNGQDATETTNALGNLLVGYQELRVEIPPDGGEEQPPDVDLNHRTGRTYGASTTIRRVLGWVKPALALVRT